MIIFFYFLASPLFPHGQGIVPQWETVIFPVYKKKIPENRGLFHNFRFSLGYDNLQQAGISEDVGSLTVFIYTAGKGASCPYCGHFSH